MSDETPNAPLLLRLAKALGVSEKASEQDLVEAAEYRADLERTHLDVLAQRDELKAERDDLARRLYHQQRRAAGRRSAAQPGEGKP